MAEDTRSATVGALAGFVIAVLTWVFLAGGQAATISDHERRITALESIQKDLGEIKATLRQIQAEQRILHGKELGQ